MATTVLKTRISEAEKTLPHTSSLVTTTVFTTKFSAI